MEFKRINGRVDINSEITNGNIVADEEEQRGARTNKFWFNNYEYLYKDVYPTTYEDYAEIIAYKLADYLGIECASYDLAIYNGSLGVITKNLIKDNDNEELLSGAEIITQVYAEYIVPINKAMEEYKSLMNRYKAHDPKEFSMLSQEEQLILRNKFLDVISNINIDNKYKAEKISREEDIDLSEIEKIYEYLDSFIDIYNSDFTEMKNGIIKANNLYDIWNVLEVYASINNLSFNIEEAMDNLINMFIFDIITSQGDRHADNWGIIKNDKDNSIRICPLYDNSNICSLNREKAIKNIVSYVNDLNNESLSDRKKQKVQSLLESTINHSNSGLKVDLIDVEKKHKNRIMIKKFINDSSSEFNDKLISISKKINEDVLNNIFNEIEKETGITMPDEVKVIVKTVIMINIEMIKEIYEERSRVK